MINGRGLRHFRCDAEDLHSVVLFAGSISFVVPYKPEGIAPVGAENPAHNRAAVRAGLDAPQVVVCRLNADNIREDADGDRNLTGGIGEGATAPLGDRGDQSGERGKHITTSPTS
jgi:hypothetical protein